MSKVTSFKAYVRKYFQSTGYIYYNISEPIDMQKLIEYIEKQKCMYIVIPNVSKLRPLWSGHTTHGFVPCHNRQASISQDKYTFIYMMDKSVYKLKSMDIKDFTLKEALPSLDRQKIKYCTNWPGNERLLF